MLSNNLTISYREALIPLIRENKGGPEVVDILERVREVLEAI